MNYKGIDYIKVLNNETNVKCEAEFQISNLSFSCLSKKSKDLQNLENNIKIQNIQSNLAYPVGGNPDEFKYFVLEIHYNNPSSLPGI